MSTGDNQKRGPTTAAAAIACVGSFPLTPVRLPHLTLQRVDSEYIVEQEFVYVHWPCILRCTLRCLHNIFIEKEQTHTRTYTNTPINSDVFN